MGRCRRLPCSYGGSCALEPHFAVAHARVGLGERGPPTPRLHLVAGEHDAALEGLEDAVVVAAFQFEATIRSSGCRVVGAIVVPDQTSRNRRMPIVPAITATTTAAMRIHGVTASTSALRISGKNCAGRGADR